MTPRKVYTTDAITKVTKMLNAPFFLLSIAGASMRRKKRNITTMYIAKSHLKSIGKPMTLLISQTTGNAIKVIIALNFIFFEPASDIVTPTLKAQPPCAASAI